MAHGSVRRANTTGHSGPIRTHGRLVSTRLAAAQRAPRVFRAMNAARRREDDTRYALLCARSVTQPARNAILLHIRPRRTPHRPLSPTRKAPLSWKTAGAKIRSTPNLGSPRDTESPTRYTHQPPPRALFSLHDVLFEFRVTARGRTNF